MGDPDDTREILRRDGADVRLERQSSLIIPEHPEPGASTRTQDEILIPIAIVVEPRDAGSEVCQRVWQQELPLPVVEGWIVVLIAPDQSGNVPEEDRRQRIGWSWRCYSRLFSHFIQSISANSGNHGSSTIAPFHHERRAV